MRRNNNLDDSRTALYWLIPWINFIFHMKTFKMKINDTSKYFLMTIYPLNLYALIVKKFHSWFQINSNWKTKTFNEHISFKFMCWACFADWNAMRSCYYFRKPSYHSTESIGPPLPPSTEDLIYVWLVWLANHNSCTNCKLHSHVFSATKRR